VSAVKEKQTFELAIETDGNANVPARIDPPAPASRSPIDVVAELVARGIKPADLSQILDIQTRHEAEQARRAFAAAMARFKSEEIGEIKKTKHVKFKTRDGDEIEYMHETLDDVVKAIRAPMAKYGLSHRWTVDQKSLKPDILVSCVITHEDGHSEPPVELYAPPDATGLKNPAQRITSTVTLLQRKTLLLAVGLAAKGEDDDGRQGARNGSPPRGSDAPAPSAPRSKGGDGKATAKQVGLLKTKLKRANIDEPELLKQFSIEQLEAMPFERVNDALAWIANHGG
jgi:hypothetical protein